MWLDARSFQWGVRLWENGELLLRVVTRIGQIALEMGGSRNIQEEMRKGLREQKQR